MLPQISSTIDLDRGHWSHAGHNETTLASHLHATIKIVHDIYTDHRPRPLPFRPGPTGHRPAPCEECYDVLYDAGVPPLPWERAAGGDWTVKDGLRVAPEADSDPAQYEELARLIGRPVSAQEVVQANLGAMSAWGKPLGDVIEDIWTAGKSLTAAEFDRLVRTAAGSIGWCTIVTSDALAVWVSQNEPSTPRRHMEYRDNFVVRAVCLWLDRSHPR